MTTPAPVPDADGGSDGASQSVEAGGASEGHAASHDRPPRPPIEGNLSEIAYGEQAVSALGETDDYDDSQRGYHERVTFEGEAGDTVGVAMIAGARSAHGHYPGPRHGFEGGAAPADPYLRVLGPDGTLLAENDDHRSLNSQITTDLPESGEYTIIATSFDRDAQLSYDLTLSRADGTAQ